MNNIARIIGERIRFYRLNSKLSQEKLAEKCGCHPTYIGQLERGEKNATAESIFKIASALEIPLSTLFENINPEQKNGADYPALCYNLILSADKDTQKKLYEILSAICKLKK